MRVFITDCEGPITKNDNAMELCGHFIPQGERFFSAISRYDDYLAYEERRPGYKAGDTLKLIAPFLIAFGVTERVIEEFSREHLLLMPKADRVLRHLQRVMPLYLVSTSYEPYIRALCSLVGLPLERTFSTRWPQGEIRLREEDRRDLEDLAQEIVNLPPLRWSQGGEVEEGSRGTLERLNEIFWDDLPRRGEVAQILSLIHI